MPPQGTMKGTFLPKPLLICVFMHLSVAYLQHCSQCPCASAYVVYHTTAPGVSVVCVLSHSNKYESEVKRIYYTTETPMLSNYAI